MTSLPRALILSANLVLLTLPTTFAFAGNGSIETFVKSNQAYEAGKYQEAVKLYKSIDASALSSAGRAQLYYNLGNAELRNNQLGKAIASYLKSYAENPRNQDLLANLKFARSTTTDDIELPKPHPIVQTLFFWHFSLGRSDLIAALKIAFIAFWFLQICRLSMFGKVHCCGALVCL